MSNTDFALKHSDAWSAFTIANFAVAAVMMAGGIYFMDAGFAAKGFYSMSALMLVQSTIAATKNIRDKEEAKRMINRIEDARTEKLLMEMQRTT